MAPDPGASKENLRTVGVAFARLVPNAAHAAAIRDAVERTHHATLLATELLNLHVRDRLANHGGGGLTDVFNANWLLNAYNEVTFARGKPKVVEELRATRDAHMPAFEPVDRAGLSQLLVYECRNLAAAASTNVWRHFRRRVLNHVKLKLALDDAAFAAITKEQRRARRLALMQVADDLLRPPSQPPRCPEVHRAWVAAERQRLGVDAAVGAWDGKPLEYHLKARPHAFLQAMHLMTTEREAAGRSAFALFPLRRALVPRHVRFDQEALRQLLKLGTSEHTKEVARQNRQAAKRRKTEAGRDLEAPGRPAAGNAGRRRTWLARRPSSLGKSSTSGRPISASATASTGRSRPTGCVRGCSAPCPGGELRGPARCRRVAASPSTSSGTRAACRSTSCTSWASTPASAS